MSWVNTLLDPHHPATAALGLLLVMLATTLLARAKARRRSPPGSSMFTILAPGLAPALEPDEADPMSRSPRFVSDTQLHVDITQDPSRGRSRLQQPTAARHSALACFLQPQPAGYFGGAGVGIGRGAEGLVCSIYVG